MWAICICIWNTTWLIENVIAILQHNMDKKHIIRFTDSFSVQIWNIYMDPIVVEILSFKVFSITFKKAWFSPSDGIYISMSQTNIWNVCLSVILKFLFLLLSLWSVVPSAYTSLHRGLKNSAKNRILFEIGFLFSVFFWQIFLSKVLYLHQTFTDCVWFFKYYHMFKLNNF